jgi:hypothetical protein
MCQAIHEGYNLLTLRANSIWGEKHWLSRCEKTDKKGRIKDNSSLYYPGKEEELGTILE